MVFNSLHFLVFFLLVVPVFFAMPPRFRWAWLLAASCYFYMAFVPAYILILFLTIGVDYVVGLQMQSAPPGRKKQLLWFSIGANVAILVLFKYLGFFTSIFQDVGLLPVQLPWAVQWLLPIGLSFHTLQAMSYTIEVYHGRQEPERHLGIFALYVLFFPQLVAGPIERPQNMLHQFREYHAFEPLRVTAGMRLMLWGLFKKVVIADRLGQVVDSIYAIEGVVYGPVVVIGAMFFAVQIFCDFSGYTDIARGAAQVLGFRLMENFNAPYLATSIADFWRRWHLSLSTWLRDYVYVPLGGNRAGFWTKQRNLAITFLVSGLWHGASWTFVVWGGLHALYQFLHQCFKEWFSLQVEVDNPRREPQHWLLPVIYQLLTIVAVVFAWIFFRSANMTQAANMVFGLFFGWSELSLGQLSALPISTTDWTLAWAAFMLMPILSILLESRRILNWIILLGKPVRYAWYYAMVLAIIFLGKPTGSAFIYFQF